MGTVGADVSDLKEMRDFKVILGLGKHIFYVK